MRLLILVCSALILTGSVVIADEPPAELVKKAVAKRQAEIDVGRDAELRRLQAIADQTLPKPKNKKQKDEQAATRAKWQADVEAFKKTKPPPPIPTLKTPLQQDSIGVSSGNFKILHIDKTEVLAVYEDGDYEETVFVDGLDTKNLVADQSYSLPGTFWVKAPRENTTGVGEAKTGIVLQTFNIKLYLPGK
jgi:hypothetical protein